MRLSSWLCAFLANGVSLAWYIETIFQILFLSIVIVLEDTSATLNEPNLVALSFL